MTLRTLQELNSLKQNNYSTFSQWAIDWVSCALDEDPENVINWSWSKVLLTLKEQQDKIKLWKPPVSVEVKSKEFYPIPFHKLSLGEFIDLEYYCTDEKWVNHVCAILYRQRTLHPLNGFEWEPYGDWLEWRSSLWLDAPAECSKIILDWINWRKDVLNRYSGIFNIPVEFDPELSTEEREQILREEEKKGAFSWEATLLMLSGDRADKVPEVLKLPLLLVFNLMSSLKNKKK